MNTVWIAGLFGLLMLCLGLLLGSSWTVQALDRQLASQRRKLNARHLEMQETGLCCSWGGNLTVSADRSSSSVGGEVIAALHDDNPLTGTSRVLVLRPS